MQQLQYLSDKSSQRCCWGERVLVTHPKTLQQDLAQHERGVRDGTAMPAPGVDATM